jgi:uncharacterized membrane protein
VLASITEFVAHFHPSLVHLPIGFLLAGLLLQWLSRKEKYKGLQQAATIVLLGGAITATLSAITGYLLSISDDYDKKLVGWHQWMGISTTIVAWMLYAWQKKPRRYIDKNIIAVVLLALIVVTGHLGGSLTHGSDYLTKPLRSFGNDSSSNASLKPVPDVQEAVAYNDIVKPILETRCYSCHGANKQKGRLRMDDEQSLMKGGKDGKVIEPGDADKSEMIRRLMLPVDNEDHMPPKEKPQPTESQIALLHWWINGGADFSKKVKELEQPAQIKPVLLALQQAPEAKKGFTAVPATPVEKADTAIIEKLKAKGIVVLPVAQNSNYLSANFVTHTNIGNEELPLLLGLKKQLIWLKMSYTNVADSHATSIGELKNLIRLNLDHTNITDAGINSLKSLSNLQYLNLVATKITAKGILQLKDLEKLQSLFVYQTPVKKEDWAALKAAFPKTQIDSGGYLVETLPTDTIQVKAKKY